MSAHRLLFADLFECLRWRFPVLVAWTALVGLGESVSVVLLLPLLSRAGVVATGTQGQAVELLEEGLSWIGATSSFEILAVILAIATAQTVLSIALNSWTAKLARRYQAQHQLNLFAAFMSAKWNFIVEKKGGELTNALITECERLGRAFNICLGLLAGAVVTAVYVCISLLISWPVTLSLIVFATMAGLMMTHLYRRSFETGKSLAPLNSELLSLVNEQIAGAKFIKASAADERATLRVASLLRKLEKANASATSLPATVRNILELFALAGLALLLVFASKGMGVAAGNAVVVFALFGRLFPRITAMQSQVHYLNNNVHAIEVISQFQQTADAAVERRDHSAGALVIDQPTNLVLRDLQVRLGNRTVIGGINLTFPIPGVLAVVGRSGAGKSTLVHALLGLVETSAGSIHLGRYDLASAPLRAWRRAIGYVPQETILFHASIRDNLTLVKPGATETELRKAVRRAHAEEFIDALPEGFDTIIGDQGVKLSGGQRQRIGIARAVLTDPVLLLMDEAMSALDDTSEAELLRTIDELRKEMGILLVAHRLATVRTADTICVMDAGRVVECGKWNELLNRRAHLHALVEAQAQSTSQRTVSL